jgi:phospholipid/cholesterol/gamma-HCH transport system substrate-binding protein
MKNLGLEFKVGMFTILGMMATGYLFFALRPDTFQNKKINSYYTHLDNAGGIVVKSHVKTNGVSIGKVRSVELQTNNTKVTIDIDAQIKIPKGSSLQIKSVGLLGDSHVEIKRTADNGEYLVSGDFIPQSTDGTDLSGLIDVAGSIAQDIKKITANLADVMGTEEGKQKIGNIVENIEELTASARGILEENRMNVKDMVANFRDVSENLSAVLDDENKDRLNRIIASFDDSMTEVKAATRNINLISQRVERGEGTLGRLVNDDTAMTELEGAIKDIREVLAPATKLQITVDAHMEGRRDETTQTYFNLMFRTRPDRYYLLGFTDTQDEIIDEKTENLDETCNEEDETCDTAKRTTRRTEHALKINLQFAKRWGFLGVRFGLFESTGGFATDFYLLRDRLRFTAEAFDWKTKDNEIRRVAHVKAYASLLFYDHIYLMAGVDDPTKYEERDDASKTQKTNYFVGAGLTFNDEDLKALFGAAAITSAL